MVGLTPSQTAAGYLLSRDHTPNGTTARDKRNYNMKSVPLITINFRGHGTMIDIISDKFLLCGTLCDINPNP
jgi:hypothetical protein